MKKGFKIPLLILIIIAGLLASFNMISAMRAGMSRDGYAAALNAYITEGDALVSAHRAGSKVAPENTMLAFKLGVAETEYDVHIWEFDLHLTKDGYLILLHDDSLNRTSDAETVLDDKDALASEYTLSELRKLNMGYFFEDEDGNFPYRDADAAELEDLRVVTLEEVLLFLEAQEDDYKYVIEIKNDGEKGELAASLLHAVLVEFKLLDSVIVGTFHGEISKLLDEKYSDITRSSGIVEVLELYYCYKLNIDLGKRIDSGKLGYTVIQIPYISFINLGTKEFIEYAHRYGLAVQYWTINDAEDIEHLNSIGADAIITDSPDLAYEIIYN